MFSFFGRFFQVFVSCSIQLRNVTWLPGDPETNNTIVYSVVLPYSGRGSLLHSISSTLLEEGSELTIFLCESLSVLSTATVSVSVDLTSSGSAAFCFSRSQVLQRAASRARAAGPRRRGCCWKGQGRCWGPGSVPGPSPRTSGAPGRGSAGGPSWISNVARLLPSWVWRWRLACPPDPHTLVKVSKSCLISP